MKYTILINQAAVVEAGLHKTTDLVDWAILEYIQTWQTNPEAERLDDFVWINYKHFIAEMPLVGLNTKGSVSRRLTKLEELSLIEKVLDEDGRAFCKTTVLFHQITQFKVKKSSKPTVHNGKHPVYDGKHPVYDGKHPVYDGKQSTDNQKQTIKTNNNSETINLNHHAIHAHELLLSLNFEESAPAPSKALSSEQKERQKEEVILLPLSGLNERQVKEASKKLAQLSLDQREIAITMFNQTAELGRIRKPMALVNQLVNLGLNNELEPPLNAFNQKNDITLNQELKTSVAENIEDSHKETVLEILKDKVTRHKDRMLEDFKRNRAIFIRGLGVFYDEDLRAAGLFD